MTQNTNEKMPQDQFDPIHDDLTGAAVLEWYRKLKSGIDVPDNNETYGRSKDHQYPRGGIMGRNAALDADENNWRGHVEGNIPENSNWTVSHPDRH